MEYSLYRSKTTKGWELGISFGKERNPIHYPMVGWCGYRTTHIRRKMITPEEIVVGVYVGLYITYTIYTIMRMNKKYPPKKE
jgi:hypothetical protein